MIMRSEAEAHSPLGNHLLAALPAADLARLSREMQFVPRAVVQIAGYASRVKADVVLREFRRGGPFALLLLRYVQALMTQMAQTAVCNRHHTAEQQLCRWLLLTLDRIDAGDVAMTQELISNMLGVRRSGVTQAARNLQYAGLIQYQRGVIHVPDRAKLEAHACECYAVVKRETDRLLPDALACRRRAAATRPLVPALASVRLRTDRGAPFA